MFSSDMYIALLIYVVLPAISGLVMFTIRGLMQRLESLETKMQTKMDAQAVRELVIDKLEPIKEDMSDIKNQLDKILNVLLNNNDRE